MGTEKKAGDLEEIQVLEGISESEEIDRRVEELMAPETERKRRQRKSKRPDPGHRSEAFTPSGALRGSAGSAR